LIAGSVLVARLPREWRVSRHIYTKEKTEESYRLSERSRLALPRRLPLAVCARTPRGRSADFLRMVTLDGVVCVALESSPTDWITAATEYFR
jgi:hypothetical protein